MKFKIGTLVALIAVIAASGVFAQNFPENISWKKDLTYKAQDGYVDILRNGQAVAKFVYKDTPKPYIYPVVAPNGSEVTKVDNNMRSMWIGFGDVNGVDFWAEGEKSGKIVQKSIKFDSLTPGYWSIHTRSDWVQPDGKVALGEDIRYTFLSSEHGILISAMIALAANADVKFADNKDGLFAVRVADEMLYKGDKGQLLNSEGATNSACMGQRAKWCDWTADINGKTSGITIFDSPYNPNYPTRWNVTDTGLLAANPFAGQSFTNKPEDNAEFSIKRGRTVILRYSVLIHDGNIDKEKLNSIALNIMGSGPAKDIPKQQTDNDKSLVIQKK